VPLPFSYPPALSLMTHYLVVCPTKPGPPIEGELLRCSHGRVPVLSLFSWNSRHRALMSERHNFASTSSLKDGSSFHNVPNLERTSAFTMPFKLRRCQRGTSSIFNRLHRRHMSLTRVHNCCTGPPPLMMFRALHMLSMFRRTILPSSCSDIADMVRNKPLNSLAVEEEPIHFASNWPDTDMLSIVWPPQPTSPASAQISMSCK
jgi:hypothetical protein